MNVDSFDGTDLIGGQCFAHDISYMPVWPGAIHESSNVVEAAYKLDKYEPNPYWK